MRICALVKYPPIQGGVSAHSYWIVRALAERGHHVTVVTNADEVEDDYRIQLSEEDLARLVGQFPDGGSVDLVGTAKTSHRPDTHTPYANPYVTKLVALACEEIRRTNAQVIFSYYLEPYGVAALLAARLTGRPFVMQHAGSDRIDLMNDPEHSLLYREVLRAADIVIAPPGTVEGFGVDADRVRPTIPGFVPRMWPLAAKTDINVLVAELAKHGHSWLTNTDPLPANQPTVLAYGKVAEQKGLFELVSALARLRDQGGVANLVLAVGGPQRESLIEHVRATGLAQNTWCLPFLPHWRMPGLIRAATAVCFLEHKFAIATHQPGVPRETLAAGTCLVVSGEIAAKQAFLSPARPGVDMIVVDDPTDIDELAQALGPIIDDPSYAETVGIAGAMLPGLCHEPELGAHYEQILRTAITPNVKRTSQNVQAGLLVRAHMPASAILLGDDFDLVCAKADPGDTVWLPERAHRIGQRLAVELADGALDEHADVVARFELDMLWLNLDLESETGTPYFPRRGNAGMSRSGRVSAEECFPVRSDLLLIRRYRDDLNHILTRLQGLPAPDPDPAGHEVTLLFVKRGSLRGKVLRVNETVLELLQSCDGRTSFADIVDKTARRRGSSSDVVRDWLALMVEERIVVV